MNATDIFNAIVQHYKDKDKDKVVITKICQIHSACSPAKNKVFKCGAAGSSVDVIDFDYIKTLADKVKGLPQPRKSTDALTVSPNSNRLCFIELKSWKLLLEFRRSKKDIIKQGKKYERDLPKKLSDSIQICQETLAALNEVMVCDIIYILLTDINTSTNGLEALCHDLSTLAGSSSDLFNLCNSVTSSALSNIQDIETRYWECWEFDKKISLL